MSQQKRRLHPHGAAARGVVVDSDGAMLGPDCVLVRRSAGTYRCVSREEAAAIQNFLFGVQADDPDRLFGLSRGIAKALNEGEVALAQIYGLRIPVAKLASRELAQLAAAAPFIKANFNPNEPRDDRGRWDNADGGGQDAKPERESSSGSGPTAWPRDGSDRHGQPAAPSIGSGPIGPDTSGLLLRPANEVTFGHGSRHAADPEAVEAAIRNALSTAPLLPGFNSGAVSVGGTWYIYRAFLLPDGRVHVGTYYPW